MTIDSKVERIIGGTKSWAELSQLEKNIKERNAFTADVEAALVKRSTELGLDYILRETGLGLNMLSSAEKKIVMVIGEYAAILRRKGKYPSRTLQQIKRRGLLDAAEVAVTNKKPTKGFEILLEADLEDLSYERVVLDHQDEFSPRAVWFARRTLRIENELENPPAPSHGSVNVRTLSLLYWIESRAETNGGIIPPFTNAEAANAIGLGALTDFGRVHGNIQSRIDLACFLCDLPPLGCAAEKTFEKAWDQEGRSWAFPGALLQQVAQKRKWEKEDFQKIRERVQDLSAQAHIPWREVFTLEEQRVRDWSFRWSNAAKIPLTT